MEEEYNKLEHEYSQSIKECRIWKKKFEIVKTILEHNELKAAECRAYKDAIVLIQQEEIEELKTQLSSMAGNKTKKKKNKSKPKYLRKSNVVEGPGTSSGPSKIDSPSYYEELKKKEIMITEAQQTIRDMKLKEIELQASINDLESFKEQIILDQSKCEMQFEIQQFQSMAETAKLQKENKLMKEILSSNETKLNQLRSELHMTESSKNNSLVQSKIDYDELKMQFNNYKTKASSALREQDEIIDELDSIAEFYKNKDDQSKAVSEQFNDITSAYPKNSENGSATIKHQSKSTQTTSEQMELQFDMNQSKSEYQQKILHLEKELRMCNETKAILRRKLLEYRNGGPQKNVNEDQ